MHVVVVVVVVAAVAAATVSAAEQNQGPIAINSIVDFVEFSKNVNSGNSGNNYSGATVIMTNDIDFEDNRLMVLEPIGKKIGTHFRGTFDGQGHVINGLEMSVQERYVGLFGISTGITIKNVVLGPSCSITRKNEGNYTSNGHSISGVLGYCLPNGVCTITSCINMAKISFKAHIKQGLFMGSMLGNCKVGSACTVKNCINYGDIVQDGSCHGLSIGGISNGNSKIYNCINYGAISHNKKSTEKSYIGGISGQLSGIASSCVSAGSISLIGDSKLSISVGSIAGNLLESFSISFCYWDNAINYSAFGNTGTSPSACYKFNASTLELSENVTVGSYTGRSLIDALNAHTSSDKSLSLWASSANENSVSFIVNNRATPMLTANKKVVLLPSLAEGLGKTFSGWFTDKSLTKPLSGATIQQTSSELYASWGNSESSVIITFVLDNKTYVVAQERKDKVTLPEDIVSSEYAVAWFMDKQYTTELAKATTVEDNITIYGRVHSSRFVVNFFSLDGNSNELEPSKSFGDLDVSDVSDGYADELFEAYVFNETVNDDMTVYMG